MTGQIKVLAFAGSLRKNSYNKKLVKIAAEGARAAGAEVTLLDLKEFPLPVFDEDLESSEGLHPNARKLKDILLAHQAFLISSPEYNSSISGALKNVIDWTSRPVQGEKMLECFQGKVAGLMSASPGGLGGLRGLVHVRAILENIGMIVVPRQVAIASASEAFEADGSLKDKKKQALVEQIGSDVTKLTSVLLPAKLELRAM